MRHIGNWGLFLRICTILNQPDKGLPVINPSNLRQSYPNQTAIVGTKLMDNDGKKNGEFTMKFTVFLFILNRFQYYIVPAITGLNNELGKVIIGGI